MITSGSAGRPLPTATPTFFIFFNSDQRSFLLPIGDDGRGGMADDAGGGGGGGGKNRAVLATY